jgi:hypothetical protein
MTAGVRNRGRFVIRFTGLICDDAPRPDITRRPWRCNCDRTANIATRIFRRIQRKRASAAMGARSARTASRTSSAICARTAAAVSCRARSGPPRNGGPAYRSKNTRHQASVCTCLIVSTISPSIPPVSGIFRLRNAEPTPSLRANGSRECAPDDRFREAIQNPRADWIASSPTLLAMTERITQPSGSSLRMPDANYGLFGSNRFSSPFQQSA